MQMCITSVHSCPAAWADQARNVVLTFNGSRTVMRAPDGTEYPTKGVFLEVVEPERIVFTDAYDVGWQPSPDAFFTAITTFEDHGGKTKSAATLTATAGGLACPWSPGART
jgi:uncharacterized protein YndB with AHSA1/START domain